MAMIECPECAREISDKAPACPACGAPQTAEPETAASGVVTTQDTAKPIKVWFSIGGLAMVIGMLMLIAGSDGGGAIMSIGFVIAVGSRIAAWWHHG